MKNNVAKKRLALMKETVTALNPEAQLSVAGGSVYNSVYSVYSIANSQTVSKGCIGLDGAGSPPTGPTKCYVE